MFQFCGDGSLGFYRKCTKTRNWLNVDDLCVRTIDLGSDECAFTRPHLSSDSRPQKNDWWSTNHERLRVAFTRNWQTCVFIHEAQKRSIQFDWVLLQLVIKAPINKLIAEGNLQYHMTQVLTPLCCYVVALDGIYMFICWRQSPMDVYLITSEWFSGKPR